MNAPTAPRARRSVAPSNGSAWTRVDSIQLHNLSDVIEWETALGAGGALEAAIEAREEGLVRFIGVTGTQLTMRTFHIGGTARLEESSKHEARQDGTIKYLDLQTVKSRKGERIAMNRNGSLTIIDDRGREAARYQIVYGAHILVEDGSSRDAGPTAGHMGSVHFRDPY